MAIKKWSDSNSILNSCHSNRSNKYILRSFNAIIIVCIQLLCFVPITFGWSTTFRYDDYQTTNSGTSISSRNRNKWNTPPLESVASWKKPSGIRWNTNLFVLDEPTEAESNFGRMKYWNDVYEKEDQFSWYSEWEDIAPFFMELVPLECTSIDGSMRMTRVLLPGIGNDKSMVEMYDSGYKSMTAFDYAPEGVACAKRFFGKERLLCPDSKNEKNNDNEEGVDLRVADARDLPYKDNSFDAVLEKGTLDAIYLSGAADKDMAMKHLSMAVSELARVTSKGGIVMSITAACADSVKEAFSNNNNTWEVLRDGTFYLTDDGYSSNNVDATIFAWKRL